MKKELQMTIKRNGILNPFICNLISSYNEGKVDYTLQEVNAILKGKKIEFPNTLENLNTIHLGNEIIISEDGKEISIIIEERDLMVLNEQITDSI